MKFLPAENIIYSTSLPETEVLQRISANVEPRKFRFWGKPGNKLYEGEIEGNSFEISRIISYRNSFLPQISGTVGKDAIKTLVNVKMSVHPLALIIILMFISVVGFIWIAALVISIINGEFSFALFGGIVFPLFGYLIMMGGFKFESGKSKQFFKDLFEAEIIKE